MNCSDCKYKFKGLQGKCMKWKAWLKRDRWQCGDGTSEKVFKAVARGIGCVRILESFDDLPLHGSIKNVDILHFFIPDDDEADYGL